MAAHVPDCADPHIPCRRNSKPLTVLVMFVGSLMLGVYPNVILFLP